MKRLVCIFLGHRYTAFLGTELITLHCARCGNLTRIPRLP
jgi:hypothetical protein